MLSSKDRILAKATRRFASQGYSGTSLQEIADDVGMRKPSLLHHFSSKAALREAVLIDLLERWQVTLPAVLQRTQDGTDRFTALFDEISDFFEADPSRALLLMREVVDRPVDTRDRLAGAIGPWMQLLRGAISEGQRSGRVRAGVDAEAYLIQCIVSMVGAFVGSQLGAEVFGGESAEDWGRRQRKEARRMARQSLFMDRSE